MKTTTKQELDKLDPQEIITYLSSRQDVIWATYETPDDFQQRIQEAIEQNDLEGCNESASFYYTDWYDRYKANGKNLDRMAFEYYERQYEYYFMGYQDGFDWEHSKKLLDEVLEINDNTLPYISMDLIGYERHLSIDNMLNG